MKILHISNDYRDNNLYALLFKELSVHVEQTVFVPYKKTLQFSSNDGYEVYHESCYGDVDRLFYKKKAKKVYRSLKRHVDITEFDMVHAHTLFSNGGVAYLLKLEFGKDYAVTIRNVDVDFFMKYFVHLRRIGINIMMRAKKIIFVSPVLRYKLLEYIQDVEIRNAIDSKSTVITNGIDSYWLLNKMKGRDTVGCPIKIVQAGWINRNKNQLSSIKAVEIINSIGIDCELDIIGGIADRLGQLYFRKVVRYVEKNQLTQKIRIIGRQNRNKLSEYFRKADIYLMPSYSETFGLVFIEAMTQGLPIIYSKNQAVDMLFDDAPVGASVNPKSPKDIADKILKLQSDYKKYTDNIVYHLDNFSWSNIVSSLVHDVYFA